MTADLDFDDSCERPISIRGEGRARLERAVANCFRESGRVTISGVCNRAGASIGTVYHHFPNGLDEMLSGVYVELRIESDEDALDELIRHDSFEQGVNAAIRAHLSWLVANPARTLYRLCFNPLWLTVEDREALACAAEHVEQTADAWYDTHVKNGEARPMPHLTYWALLFGPAQLHVKMLLAHRDRHGLRAAIRQAEPALVLAGSRVVLADPRL
jgi:AcrR family transcriptional regulator